jgi:hypothetical protein
MPPKKQQRDRFQLSHDDRVVIKKLEILTQAVEKVYPSAKWLMWRSFLQGLFVALGSTVGLSIVIALLTFFLLQTQHIPFLENLVPEKQIKELLPIDR